MTHPARDKLEEIATPEEIATAWATWRERHGGKLGPGPAFREAIAAALAVRCATLRTLQEENQALRKALEPFAHIGGSEALTETLPATKTLIVYDGSRRKFAIDWSCFLAARIALQSKSTEAGE